MEGCFGRRAIGLPQQQERGEVRVSADANGSGARYKFVRFLA